MHFKPGSTARVAADYHPAYPDPLVISAGETLTVGTNDTQWPSYVWCTNRAGKGGWVPESYVERTGGDGGIARRNYTAAELEAKAGETITLEQFEGGWYWAANQAEQRGWVPAEHVELIEENHNDPSP